MTEPRLNDTIVAANGKLFRVTSHTGDAVWAKPVGAGRARWFKLWSLELIDHDDGLWSEGAES